MSSKIPMFLYFYFEFKKTTKSQPQNFIVLSINSDNPIEEIHDFRKSNC